MASQGYSRAKLELHHYRRLGQARLGLKARKHAKSDEVMLSCRLSASCSAVNRVFLKGWSTMGGVEAWQERKSGNVGHALQQTLQTSISISLGTTFARRPFAPLVS